MLEYTLTPRDLASFAAWQASQPGADARPGRTRLVGAWLAGGVAYLVVFAISALPVLLDRQLVLAGALEVVDVAVGLAVAWWEWRTGRLAGWLQQRRTRLRARVALEKFGASRRLWLDEAGLNVASGDRSTHVAWTGITEIAETADHVFVCVGPSSHIIPRRAGVEVDALVAGLRAHVAGPS